MIYSSIVLTSHSKDDKQSKTNNLISDINMILLSRKDQQILVDTFKRDYGKLIMESKKNKIDDISFQKRLNDLVSQIDKLTNSSYLEEDNIEFLCSMSESMKIAA